jgi:hypothetical protein
MVVGAFITWVMVAVSFGSFWTTSASLIRQSAPAARRSIPQSRMKAASVASRPKSTDDRRTEGVIRHHFIRVSVEE